MDRSDALNITEFQKLLKIVSGLRGLGILERGGPPSLPSLVAEDLRDPFWTWPADGQGLDASSDITWCRALLQRKLLQDASRVRHRIVSLRALIVQARAKAVKRLGQMNGTDSAEEQVSSVVGKFASVQKMSQQLVNYVTENYTRATHILNDFDVVLSLPGTMSMVSMSTVMPLIIQMFGLDHDEGPGVVTLLSERKSARNSTRTSSKSRLPSKLIDPERGPRSPSMTTAPVKRFTSKSTVRANVPSLCIPTDEATNALQLEDTAEVVPVDTGENLESQSCRRDLNDSGGSDNSESDSESEESLPSRLSTSRMERCLSICWKCMVPPILTAVRQLKYDRSSFRADLMASLIISAAGIPKAMSYAALTGLPVAAGIVTMYVPCVVYALMGHSRQGAISPQSVPCLLLAALVEETLQGSGFENDLEERQVLTMIYTLVTGVIMLAMGLLHLSFLLQFISKPVFSGFVSASSLIAATSTAKSLLGIKLVKSPLLHETLAYIVQGLPTIQPATTAVSAAFILLYLLHGMLKSLAKRRSAYGQGWKVCARVLGVPAVVPVVLFGAFLGACICNFQPFTKWSAEHVILGCGSSSVSLIYDSASRMFNQSKYHDRETAHYSASGSGDGLNQVMDGGGPRVDFGSSDVRPSEAELRDANISVIFPVVSTLVCPMAHVPITRSSHQITLVLDLPVLAGIFDGNITHWSDPRIHRLNPNLPWSGVGQRITVVTRADTSGTTYHFSQALSAASPTISPSMHSNWGAQRQMMVQGNAEVVRTVESLEWSIGYATVNEVIARGVSTSGCVALTTSQGIVTAQRAQESAGTLLWPFQLTAYILVPQEPVITQTDVPRRSYCKARRLLHDYLELVFLETERAESLHMHLMPRPPDLDSILCLGERRLADFSPPPDKCCNIKMVGYVEPSLPSFSMPVARVQLDVGSVVTKSLMLAVVILLEHVAIVKHYAERNGHSAPISVDLMAVGLANIAGSLSGSFIVACGLSRSALNASAVSQVSLLLSAVISLIIVYAVAPVISMLPDPVLGVVLFMAVIHMVDTHMVQVLVKLRMRGIFDLISLTVAFVATCVLGVVQGMMTAVAFSMVVFIFNSTYPQVSELRRSSGSAYFRDAKPYDAVSEITSRFFPPNEPIVSSPLLVLRFEAPLWFANVGRLRDIVMAKLPVGTLKTLVLDMSTVPWMDATAALEFDKLLSAAQEYDVDVFLVAADQVVRDMLMGICGESVSKRFCDSVYEAQLPKRKTAWEDTSSDA